MASRKYEYPMASLHAYRTKMDLSHTVKGSFKHGELIPFDVIEVLPGDTFKIDEASLLRMSTPIAPIMDNVHMFLSAWFVPSRLVYDNWEQLMGANKDGAWLTDKGNYVVPTASAVDVVVGSIGDYMGIPLLPYDPEEGVYEVSALQARGYYMIWNENFRSEVVSAPAPIDRSSNDDILVSDYTILGKTHVADLYSNPCLPLAKFSDYFVKALPQPIKHDPIPFIPDDIPVGLFAESAGTLSANRYDMYASGLTLAKGEFKQAVFSGSEIGSPSIVAKATNETWNTIEAIRVAFQLDKFYWKDGAYGSRYWEILEGHFAVTNKAGVLQLPQKLGEIRWRINVDQVLSTAGYEAGDQTTVGAPGANSVTVNKGQLFTFSATEHGYIYILGGTRHDHTYGQGLHKQWTRSDRLDFYDPVFANIGEQPVYLSELYLKNQAAKTTVFGYQEAWAEYRFIPDRVCGILNPDKSNSLDFWTLADKFESAPLLNETFIYENRNSISRALVTGSEGPDFIFDIYFKVTAVREMPLFSIPGLADHH